MAERPTLRAPALALRLMDALMKRNEAAAANPAYLDTWAAAAAATGDFERAVDLQRRAVTAAEALENPPYLPVLRQHLEQFEAGEPVFEAVPWAHPRGPGWAQTPLPIFSWMAAPCSMCAPPSSSLRARSLTHRTIPAE